MCLHLAVLAPPSDVGYIRHLCHGLCASAGDLFLQPSPCGCAVSLRPPLQLPMVLNCHREGKHRARCAGPQSILPGPPHPCVCVLPGPPHPSLCVCAAPFTAGLSLQAPVSWSTMGRPGTSIASSAAAASSPLGHAPSSQTRRIIIVSPATRASSLLAALDAKRYMGPDSPESPALMQGALCSCLSPVTGASTPAGLFPFACVSPACVSFLQTLTKGGVTYRDEPWHKECFVCTGCKTPLAGQQFTSQDDNPYCIKCFGNLYAKKCSACTKPITGEQNSSERNTVMQ